MTKLSQRFDNCTADEWAVMVHWCEHNLGVRWEKVWDHYYQLRWVKW
jgi:hypothetical protein